MYYGSIFNPMSLMKKEEDRKEKKDNRKKMVREIIPRTFYMLSIRKVAVKV